MSNENSRHLYELAVKNIPGGVAYSKENSKFGYFNNPLRLSHPEFIQWFDLRNNKERLLGAMIRTLLRQVAISVQ